MLRQLGLLVHNHLPLHISLLYLGMCVGFGLLEVFEQFAHRKYCTSASLS